jgi:hypothetical protein
MFVVILLLLGFCFGFAARLPWGLLAFLVPLALTLAATDRSATAVVVGFVATAIGVLVGVVVATRADEERTA